MMLLSTKLGLVHRVVADYPFPCWSMAQIKIFSMVYYSRNAVEGANLIAVWKPLISDANNTLGLLTDDGKFIRRWEGIGSGRFSFD